jgi:hypothetical protein
MTNTLTATVHNHCYSPPLLLPQVRTDYAYGETQPHASIPPYSSLQYTLQLRQVGSRGLQRLQAHRKLQRITARARALAAALLHTVTRLVGRRLALDDVAVTWQQPPIPPAPVKTEAISVRKGSGMAGAHRRSMMVARASIAPVVTPLAAA